MIRRVIVLALAMAALTWFIGWWGVLLVSIGWGLVAETHTNPARTTALAAMLTWSALLLFTAMRGPVWRLSETLADIFGMPAFVLLIATFVYPGLLAFSATGLVGEAKGLRKT